MGVSKRIVGLDQRNAVLFIPFIFVLCREAAAANFLLPYFCSN